MRSRVVVVAYEAPVQLEQVRLHFVGFVESFNLATGGRPSNTSSDMLNPQLTAVPTKLWGPASSRFELGSLISENLLWNTIPFNSFFKQQNGVLSGWTPNLNWPRNEAWVIILVAHHPEIVAAKLKIRLPEAVVVFSLETFGSPCFSRLAYRVVQACFADNMVRLVVIYDEAFVA